MPTALTATLPANAALARPRPLYDVRSHTERLSDAIAIARVVCILGVVYVHAWTGVDSGALLAKGMSGQESLRWILMEAVGRSAVPLLGLISGWLVAGSSRTRDWRTHISRKARTILLPMVLWNIIAVTLVAGFAWFGSLRGPTPTSLEWVAQELFILTRNPDINVQMPFLRDLFLCMVAAPLLVRLPTWSIALVALVAAGCTVMGWGAPVLMRTSILAFFALGMIARRLSLEKTVANMSWGLALLPFLALMPVKLMFAMPATSWVLPPHTMAAVDLVARLCAALFFWRLAWGLAGTSARTLIKRVEPYAFFMFCFHLTLIWLLAPVIGHWTGPLGSPAYPPFLILLPLLVLGASMAVGWALTRVWPSAATILSGGRLKRTH